MDKIVELIGKLVEKLTSAKLLWTLLIAIVIFGLTVVIAGTNTTLFGLNCLSGNTTPKCVPANLVGIATLVAIALIVGAIVVWIAGRIKERYFV